MRLRVLIFTLLMLLAAASRLRAQDNPFEAPPSSPFRVAGYLGSAERDARETLFSYGVQIELKSSFPVFAFIGSLNNAAGDVLELGAGAGMHVGRPRIFAGAAVATYNLDRMVAGLRSGLDIAIIDALGLRAEVRNYGGHDWVYMVGVIAPPFKKPEKKK